MVWKFSVRPCGALGGDFIDEVSSAGDILQIILRKKAKQHFVGTVHIVCGAGSM